MPLGGQQAFFGSSSGPCPDTGFGWSGGAADQIRQPVYGILAIALLAAETLGSNHENAIGRHPATGQMPQPRADFFGKRRAISSIEVQLHDRGDFVDILPAGPGSPDEVEFQFFFRNGNVSGYL